MINHHLRDHSNLAMLEFLATKLEPILDEFVFVGGCTTALFINDPGASVARATLDVDSIVDVVSLSQYYNLESRLVQLGFKRSMQDSIICRWHYDNLIFDIVPTDKNILGFANIWYKEAIQQPIMHQLRNGLIIKSINIPYFLATKLEAFKDRGNHDFFASHDFEDIISIIDGHIETVEEIKKSSLVVKKYLKQEFSQFILDKNFSSALPGHLNYGPFSQKRTDTLLEKIQNIIEIECE